MGNFSEPRQGIHSIRIFDIAVVDLILTIILSIIISRHNFIAVFIILVIISILVHSMLGIKTKTNAWLMPPS